MIKTSCRNCVMDKSASDFAIQGDGCNYCAELKKKIIDQKNTNIRTEILRGTLEKIKSQGRSGDYDCVVGVSGGVDSSYVLLKAVEWGLKPLAVHMDNTWNSELASTNIRNLVNHLGVDLKTTVVDWSVYKKMGIRN